MPNPLDFDEEQPRRRRDRDEDGYDNDDRPRRRRPDDFTPSAEKPNGLATAGFVLGLLALCTGPCTGIPALICGGIALGKPGRRNFAMIGVVLGGLGTLLSIPIAIGLLLPAVQKVREAAARQKDMLNLKITALGALQFENSYDKLPPAEENVSWRVHILPYMEQSALRQQFNMNEPWDGPTNKRLANQQIREYVSLSDPPGTVDTHYRVFVGPKTLYPVNSLPVKPTEVKDGLSNTIFAVESRDAVPWPQPKELQYDPNGPLPPLGFAHRKGFLVVMLDGSVQFVSDKVSPDRLRNAIEPADGIPIDLE